jgi:hypothetical protein
VVMSGVWLRSKGDDDDDDDDDDEDAACSSLLLKGCNADGFFLFPSLSPSFSMWKVRRDESSAKNTMPEG